MRTTYPVIGIKSSPGLDLLPTTSLLDTAAVTGRRCRRRCSPAYLVLSLCGSLSASKNIKIRRKTSHNKNVNLIAFAWQQATPLRGLFVNGELLLLTCWAVPWN